jgi:hypothetical protein
MRHKFFAMMGGFHVYKGPDDPYRPDNPRVVAGMAHRGTITLPTLEEIDDRSKSGGGGGALTKTLISIQSFWFLVQCFVRATTESEFNSQTQSMRISKLEILTLAYMMMAFWIYLAWWNKPLNVNRPIRTPPILHPFPSQGPTLTRARIHRPKISLKQLLKKYHRKYVKAVNDLIGFTYKYTSVAPKPVKNVPMFYGGEMYNYRNDECFWWTCLIGSLFAGINCIAWSYESPTLSLTELFLWRLSSLAGISLALQLIVTFLMARIVENRNDDREDWRRSYITETFLAWTMTLWAVIYVTFRIISIVLAIRELTAAPLQLGIYESVHWVDLIPHV